MHAFVVLLMVIIAINMHAICMQISHAGVYNTQVLKNTQQELHANTYMT